MGFKSFFKRQLSTVIEWTNQDSALLFCKAETPTSEIKNASKLIIAPGQACILVYEGKVQDVLTDPGMYFLESDNHPFVTNFLNLRQAFESEHKMHLYFYRTAEVVNQPWGTSNPVKYMDPIYKFPVQLGAYGNYSIKITEPVNLFANIIGSKNRYTTADAREVILGRITPEFISALAGAAFSYNEIDAHLVELSGQMKEKINQAIAPLGMELTDFRVESATFDDETQQRINQISQMTSEALAAAEVGLNYVDLEKLRALRDAARNEGGLAGAGLQVGAGLELSKSILQQKDEIVNNGKDDDPVTQLKKLKLLLDEEIITQQEFDQKKKELLDKM